MRLLPLLFSLFAVPALAFDLPSGFGNGTPGEAALLTQQIAPGTWVLRQSKSSHFEAPFMYLLAGQHRALLLDTGAEPERGAALPLRQSVDRLLATWPAAQASSAFPLVVAHSHAHGDHHGGDGQFEDRPNTQIVGLDAATVAEFFGLPQWPEGAAEFDLGERVLVVLPLPGHEPAHIALYDARTKSMFSGDSLYPGLITIRDRAAFRRSLDRLAAFADGQAIERFLGAHIEMSAEPGRLYPLGSLQQPQEHPLPMQLQHVMAMQASLAAAGDFRHDIVLDDLALTQVLPEAQDRPSTHGMLLLGDQTLWVSHLPMFHSPHDYQAIARIDLPEAALAAYRADLARHPESLYTVAPTATWVLPNEVKAGGGFRVDLYRGHFERGGEAILRDVAVSVRELVHLRRFAGADVQPQRWISFGAGDERFLAHRIGQAPDFDQIVRVDATMDSNEVDGPSRALKVGERVGGARVRAVVYTEFGDLAE